jgi:hypothetical protein
MRVVCRIALCCALCLLILTTATARQGSRSKTFHTEGVFSSIVATEGGDYAGMQVYLTDSDGQFYATVTIAQGVLLPPVLVKVRVQVEERKIEFSLPDGDGSRKFKGTVSADGLTLSDGESKLFLKRKCYD